MPELDKQQRATLAESLVGQSQAAETPPATTGETVTIACKAPNGLRIYNYREEEYDDPMFGGGYRRSKRYLPIPETELLVRGPGRTISMMPLDQIDQFAPGGYGLTPGVPKELWEGWLKWNKDSPLVKNRVIFAAPDTPRAAAQAREQRDVQSGLQPVDPNNIHKRIPRATHEPRIETAEGMGVLGKK